MLLVSDNVQSLYSYRIHNLDEIFVREKDRKEVAGLRVSGRLDLHLNKYTILMHTSLALKQVFLVD